MLNVFIAFASNNFDEVSPSVRVLRVEIQEHLSSRILEHEKVARIEETGCNEIDAKLNVRASSFVSISSRCRSSTPTFTGTTKLDTQPARTSWDAVCSKYPSIVQHWPRPPKDKLFRRLVDLPACNELKDNPHAPKHRKSFSLRRKTNIRAALIQVLGKEQPKDSQCSQCSSKNGPWDRCVRADPSLDDINPLAGACANCFYNGRGWKCSFRQLEQLEQLEQPEQPESKSHLYMVF